MEIIVHKPIYHRNGIGGKSFYLFDIDIIPSRGISNIKNIVGIVNEDQVYEKEPDLKIFNPKNIRETYSCDDERHEIIMKLRDHL